MNGLALTSGVTHAGGRSGNEDIGLYLGETMSHRDSGRSADGQHDAPRPSWPDGTTYPYPLPFPLAQALDGDEIRAADGFESPAGSGPPGASRGGGGVARGTAHFRARPVRRDSASAVRPADRSSYPWPPAPLPAWLRGAQGTGDPADSGGRRRHAGRRWLLPAGLAAGAVGLGAAAVLMTGGHPSAPATGSPASPSVAPSMAVVQAGKPRAGAERAPSAAPSPRPPDRSP